MLDSLNKPHLQRRKDLNILTYDTTTNIKGPHHFATPNCIYSMDLVWNKNENFADLFLWNHAWSSKRTTKSKNSFVLLFAVVTIHKKLFFVYKHSQIVSDEIGCDMGASDFFRAGP